MTSTSLLLTASTFVTICVSMTAGQLSIPARSLGFVYGGSDQKPEVQVVAYLDPTCPDSKAVFPTLLKLAQHYRSEQVQLRMHLHNLPYHRNSHVIAKAAHVLNDFAPNKDMAFRWLGLVYKNPSSIVVVVCPAVVWSGLMLRELEMVIGVLVF
ncbi:thioredoxin superfamily protein [Elysia marginata]|uniref:Thioredoxin superfamily protein n=1 Tax=Elysia marginata TaxID=1093978 RepID=A0AAV4JPT3_9GAST|nr:thioredoxin superfamily protein [Elysia marginata]